MHPLWKVYKSKVMKTINPEDEEHAATENSEPECNMTPIEEGEGPSAVSQLAKKMQGAGAKGWKSMSALFNKDDEHQLLESESQRAADHPLAVKPEELRPNKRATGFWDTFATKWQQEASARQASTSGTGTAAASASAEEEVGAGSGAVVAQEEGIEVGGRGQEREAVSQCEGEESEGGGGGGGVGGNSFSKYTTLGGGGAAFKWNFVTSKLAELKTKSMNKTN